MHLSLRSILATATIGLALVPAGAFADEATSDFFVARDACGGTDPANVRLSSALGAFSSGCGSIIGGILGTEETASTDVDELLPLTIDATRPIHVEIAVSSDPGVVLGGIGDETVSVTLTGTKGSKTVSFGSKSTTTDAATMLQQSDNVYAFDFPLDATKAGIYKGFSLDFSVGGSQQSGYIDYGGGSFVSIPVPDPIEEPTG
jgi:hypothetical protein